VPNQRAQSRHGKADRWREAQQDGSGGPQERPFQGIVLPDLLPGTEREGRAPPAMIFARHACRCGSLATVAADARGVKVVQMRMVTAASAGYRMLHLPPHMNRTPRN
jgi:hypothetical protein